jgi:hypothetical protein
MCSQASFIIKSPEIIQAAQNGKEEIVRIAIANGADVTAADRIGFTGAFTRPPDVGCCSVVTRRDSAALGLPLRPSRRGEAAARSRSQSRCQGQERIVRL